MQSQHNFSQSSKQFLSKFKLFLELKKLDITDFFNSLQTVKPGQLSKRDFSSIISKLNIDSFSIFDPQSVFKQFTNNKTIDINHLIEVFKSMSKYFQNFKQNQKKKNVEEEKNRLSIGRLGVKKLWNLVRSSQNPFELLAEFDFAQKNALNKTQFQGFLRSTDIKQFSSAEVRRVVAQHIFRQFIPQLQIPMKKWASMFKIKEKYQQYLDSLIKRRNSHIYGDQGNIDNSSLSQRELVVITHPIQTLIPNQKPVTVTPSVQSPASQQDVSLPFDEPSKVNYPHAIKYYLLGNNPNPSEAEMMYDFQALLVENKKFVDAANPQSQDGVYKSASQFFKGEPFFLFQQAASVIMREKSRIGKARQLQPKDIIQGELGDCYFLSSIASVISIYAELIAERFLLNVNPVGYYAVKLFIDGQWKIIVTDDRFPCRNNRPVYASPHHNELWAILLEKCWAKVFSSYEAIVQGNAKQGFVALTGAPCETFSHQKEEELQELMKQLQLAQQKRYVSTASGSDYLKSFGQNAKEKFGLIPGHSYSILKIVKFDKQVLLKIRNPWGSTTWNGDWSFQSVKWTKQLRDKYNYHINPDDGSFYMPKSQFSRYFGSVVICKINPTYTHESIRVKTNRRKSAYLQMTVKTAGQYIVSIYQQNKRKYHNMIGYQYSNARLIILQKQGDNYNYVGARATSSEQVCNVDVELHPGEYTLSAKVFWKHWEDYELTLTSYGVQKTVFTPINRQVAPNFKQNLIHSYMLKFQGTGSMKSYQQYGFNATSQTNFNIKTGIGFIRTVNDSAKGFKSTLQIECKGLKIIKPDSYPIKFDVTNKFDQVVGFFVNPAGFSYSSEESIVRTVN